MNVTYINGYNQARKDILDIIDRVNKMRAYVQFTPNALLTEIIESIGKCEPNWTEPEQPQYARPYGRDQQCTHEQEAVQTAAAEELAKIVKDKPRPEMIWYDMESGLLPDPKNPLTMRPISRTKFEPLLARDVANRVIKEMHATSPGDGEYKLADEDDDL